MERLRMVLTGILQTAAGSLTVHLVRTLDYVVAHRWARVGVVLVPYLLLTGHSDYAAIAFAVGVALGGLLGIALAFNQMLKDLLGEPD